MSSRSTPRWQGRSISNSKANSARAGALRQASFIESLENRLYLSTTAYTWQNASLGAGGFVDGIFYDPKNQNTIYARTDIGGLYKTTNDGSTWSQLLDFVGNNASTSGNGTQSQEIGVMSFAIDPENSNNLYADVGQYSGTNGDVLYSTNGGQTWSQTSLSFYVGGNSNGRGDGEEIAVDPNDSNIVFLGTNNSGLWESTNAGHSFSKVSAFTPTSTTFVLFDPTGTVGNPSQTIYVGADSTNSGTNLYRTTNGGTSWAQVAITSGTGPASDMPGHAALTGGYLYLAYANSLAPGGGSSSGGVFRFQPSTGAWANITPVTGTGYIGLAADPQNPNTVVVSTMDNYSGPDRIFRTTTANTITGTGSAAWTDLYDHSSSVQNNSGFGSYNTTRNYTNFPYLEASNDGTSNWVDAIAINPFNSNQLMYGTGQGLWATNNASNGGANTQLTAPNSWYFPDAGIEFTYVNGLAAGSSGVPLFSSMLDVYGFASTTITSSPAQGADAPFSSSAYAVDEAGNLAVIVGAVSITTGASGTSAGTSVTYYGMYSTNDGVTYTPFATAPSSGSGTESVAVSANGGTIVWAQNGKAPYYSTNHGTTWTASTGGMASGGQIVADRQNANDFYYHVGTSLYFSSNGGVSFTLETSSAPSGGDMAVNPFSTGNLWIAASGGLYESTNSGASFTKITSSLTSTSGEIALGAPAPGQTLPAIYVFGTIAGFLGIYRSDDGGATWTQINNTSTQWGGLVTAMAADPNDFGRVYLGINGRGIITGNPVSTLPANWVDTDINTPGNPGWSNSSTTLSNGTTANLWVLSGGGEGIAGSSLTITSLTDTSTAPGPVDATAVTASPNGLQVGDLVTISGATPSGYDGNFIVSSIINSTTFTFVTVSGLATASGTITESTNDQFNFAYEPFNGSVTVSAQLLSLTNADDGEGTPVAGVMVRSSTDNNDPFVAMLQTTGNSLEFEYRSTTGGSVTTQTLGSVPVGAEYVEIVHSGNNFSGFYSSNGSNWTQLGSTVAIAAMPTIANVGLAASASFNSQLTTASFSNVVVAAAGPTVAQAAAANPNPVTTTSTALTVLGAENGNDTGLTYNWSYTGPSGVTYSGATNGTNAAKNITAIFTQAGSYNFTATITDASNLSVTSSIAVTVNQTPTTVVVSPATSPVVPVGFSQQFSATAADQFGNAIASPAFTWGITGAGNSVDTTGNATLGATPGSFSVTATDGSAHGSATVIAENFAVPAGSTLDINLGPAGPVAISASGGSITASQNGVQITLSGFTGVTVTDTASGDVLNFNGPLALPFTFVGAATATVNVNSGTLTFAIAPINIGTLSIAGGATAVITPATTDTPSILTVNTLSVATTGVLDVTNNEVLINYGSAITPIASIMGWIISGNNSGSWTGYGIISSTARTNPSYGLGYADSADPNNPANLPSGHIEILYTLLGDANLDGKVNGTDFNILAANFNTGGDSWDQGDFTYDGKVNGSDFNLQAENFNQGSQIAVAAAVTPVTVAQSTSTTSSNPTTGTTTTVDKVLHKRKSRHAKNS